MAGKKAEVSRVQLDAQIFNQIKHCINKYGYQAVADAGGLSCYQTVWKYVNGNPVRKLSEEKILIGVRKLITDDTKVDKLVQDIINYQQHKSWN